MLYAQLTRDLFTIAKFLFDIDRKETINKEVIFVDFWFTVSIEFILGIITRGQSNLTKSASHGGPIPRLGVTPGGRKLYH